MGRLTPKRHSFALLLTLALTLCSIGQESRPGPESTVNKATLNKAKTTNTNVEDPKPKLELSRPVRPWEFVSATGTRAALFGNEVGQLEAWVYPLKILRNFHLRFHLGSLNIPAESLARTITVSPESTCILYAGDTFTIRETLFVPVHEPGAIIKFEIDAAEPVEIEAVFQRDFQLEWPGAISGIYSYWDQTLRAFVFYDELKRYQAVIGSPTADLTSEEYETNSASSLNDSLRLGVTSKGRDTKVIVIGASTGSIAGSITDSTTASTTAPSNDDANAKAESVYNRLSTSYDTLLHEASEYYRAYLDRTVNLDIPDKQLQTAYDWSRVSMIQGLVQNPFLGSGLVAGYRTSGDTQRPGFAWFFGRDALWTALALNASGDFTTTRTALNFLGKYQRNDGKIPHEVSQSASLVPWFKDYPYPYVSADATPLFIIVMNDYVTASGDVAYAKEKWDSVWKAYEFLRSTYDAHGFAQNQGVGHGWIEGGPLLPVKAEIYQSALGLEAVHALSHLALLLGKKDLSRDLEQQFATQRPLFNQIFWSEEKNAFVYAFDNDDKRLDTTSVLATVPMWFGLVDEAKTEKTIDQLAASDQQTDWGMRIISSKNPNYNPGGYHYGSVWPLFTGWAATGEYRYHRALPAYLNLRSNALLGLDGALGHVTEVLSGDYYQPLFGSAPHQMWSVAMVVNPVLRGLFGLAVDAASQQLTFAPHVPADWSSFRIENLTVGPVALKLEYARTSESISLDLRRTGTGPCSAEFSPALSLRAEVVGATMNGRPVAFHVETNSVDQHVTVQFPISEGENKLSIRFRNDFGVSLIQELPALGASSQGLRVVSESWTPDRDALTLEVSGVPGKRYELAVRNPEQIASVDGAQLITDGTGAVSARIQLSPNEQSHRIVFHFQSSHS
jgi:glycogen debranching enzyme